MGKRTIGRALRTNPDQKHRPGTTVRTLRSKKHRARLWEAAAGRCQRCGQPLEASWHADHTIPWVHQHTTNVHMMQALCPACNYRKGTTMLRQHQREMEQRCREIRAGVPISRIFVGVTPGGGKSVLPVLLAHWLIPTVADGLCWVVPRQSLQRQAEHAFRQPHIQRLIGHRSSIRASTNETDPCRGHHGYVTTYQAICADPTLHAAEFARRRYILVLDEPHHVEEGGRWHQALQPLVDQAPLLVLMSGTWERHRGERIAFLPYRSHASGLVPDLTPTSDTAVIHYSRTDALREQAIKPLRLLALDGRAEWVDRSGDSCQVESLAEAGDHVADALMTALQTDYALHLLHRCVQDWQALRAVRPSSKLLIVAAKIARAQDYLTYLHTIGVTQAAVATSDDSQQAIETIERFKLPPENPQHLDALVTVAMAYEGMDVAGITHIACLTHIRSKPWIEQMMARAVRVETGTPYAEQTGYIYGPDDPLLHACFAAIRTEQAPLVRDWGEADEMLAASSDGVAVSPPLVPSILPVSSAMTRERTQDLDSGETLDYAETHRLRTILDRYGLGGVVDPLVARRLFQEFQTVSRSSPDPSPSPSPSSLPPAPSSPSPAVAPANDGTAMTPSMRESHLRRQIEQFIRNYEARRGVEHGSTNQLVVQMFGKSRTLMTEAELMQVWQWLQRYCTQQ